VERHNFTEIPLAHHLKETCQKAFGLTSEFTFGDTNKESPIPYWGMSPREMFQEVGQLMKIRFGSMFWVKRWLVTYKSFKDDCVIVPDIRFNYEADFLRSIGAGIIHLRRPDAQKVRAHESELGVTSKDGDWLIENTGSLKDLEDKVESFMAMNLTKLEQLYREGQL
jgi:hypothetical protein